MWPLQISPYWNVRQFFLPEININIIIKFVFHLNVTILDICDHYELVPILAGARASPYIELRDKKVLSKTRSWVKFYNLETLTWIAPVGDESGIVMQIRIYSLHPTPLSAPWNEFILRSKFAVISLLNTMTDDCLNWTIIGKGEQKY